MMELIAKSVRPVITYLFAFLYMAVSTWGVIVGKIEFSMYFAQVGTMVSMIISFWFAERKDKNVSNDN